MRHRPKVSVIVTSYNRPNFLRECLESIKAQDYRDMEVVIGDDGSDLAVADVAEAWGARFVTGEHSGLCAVATNRGIRVAGAENVVLVADDDMLPPESIKVRLAALEAAGSDAFVCGAGHVLMSCVGFTAALKAVVAGRLPETNTFLHARNRWMSIHGGSVLAPYSFFERFGLMDEHLDLRLGHEAELWARWIEQGMQPIHCGRAVTIYRIHRGSLSYSREEGECDRKDKYRDAVIELRSHGITSENTLMMEQEKYEALV